MTDQQPTLPRCGDVVFHRPSGERWIVAWAEGDDLAWTGWPNGVARLSDCDVVRRCTDAQHVKAVEMWLRPGQHDSRSARVRRLYGATQEGLAEQKAATEIFVHSTPQCDHDFGGWRAFSDGNGGEQVCRKCGMGAMEWSLRHGE